VNFFRNRLFEYGAAVYGGGSCLLARLERRMGRARFRAALRAYAVGHRYGWSTAEAFMAAMDGAAGSRPLGDLWRAYRVR
jgi:aminopeptidase N